MGRNRVSATINGWFQGTFNPTGRIIVYGRAGNDFLSITPIISLPAFLYGGAGDDYLIAGSSGGVLVGGAGNNILVGAAGRNVLVGGKGSGQRYDGVQVYGTQGDNVVIGGTTDYDTNDLALANVLAEWSRTDADYQTRVAHLRGPGSPSDGRKNGNFFLNTATVHDNGTRDRLFGGSGQNWYLAHTGGASSDSIFGRKLGAELLDEIV